MRNRGWLSAAFFLAGAQTAFAAANLVHHERTANITGGSCGVYASPLAPAGGQTDTIRFKVEFQGFTQQARVYYTTDGTTPGGAFGVPSGSSQVAPGAYLCTFPDLSSGTPETVDVVTASINGQPGGTTVKYVVSAWNTGGTPIEIFANSGTCATCTACTTSPCATVFQYVVGPGPTNTPTPTSTSTRTLTPTTTPTPTRTSTPTNTPAATPSPTPSRTPTPTSTSTPTRTFTNTSTSTRTPTGNASTPTPTPTGGPPRVTPVALAVDRVPDASDGNGVFEPGETATVEPTWKNFGPDSLTLSGTSELFDGPAGAAYGILDGAALYGTLESGEVKSCTADANCYRLSVSSPAPRPAPHWDSTFIEKAAKSPARFVFKQWTLHIGDSFTDVPRSELFYTKIETIFHNGITVGCTPTAYCPSDKVPRSQMAIFIARGVAHGAALPTAGNVDGTPYNCTAGGISAFTDISPTAIYCKGVHFIAAKNVTAGCAPSLFCPDPNVTRAEMAIFMAKGMVAPGGGAAVPPAYGPDPTTGFSYSCNAGSPNLHFVDVSTSDSFCKHVHYLWARGVIAGCSADHYCPELAVGRDEMSKFLANALGLQLYGP